MNSNLPVGGVDLFSVPELFPDDFQVLRSLIKSALEIMAPVKRNKRRLFGPLLNAIKSIDELWKDIHRHLVQGTPTFSTRFGHRVTYISNRLNTAISPLLETVRDIAFYHRNSEDPRLLPVFDEGLNFDIVEARLNDALAYL